VGVMIEPNRQVADEFNRNAEKPSYTLSGTPSFVTAFTKTG